MNDVIVIGAGFVGLSTAIALRHSGRDVVLVDKEGLGAGASYGNAGVIQSEAMVPYAMPRGIVPLARILMGMDTAVALRLPDLFSLAGPLAKYFLNSSPKRVKRAAQTYSKLTAEAAQAHLELATLTGASALFQAGGYRLRYDRRSEMDKAAREANQMAQDHNLALRILSPDAFSAAEPGLADPGAGAIEWSDPLHIAKPFDLLQSHFDYFRKIGGSYSQGDGESLTPVGSGWSIQTKTGVLSASQVVVAAGADTVHIARQLGGNAPIIPKRGYHAVLSGGRRLNVPLVDAEAGFAYSPQDGQMRVATGAELGGAEALDQPRQLLAAVARAARLFGTDETPVSTWSGRRPCMPDMLPVMGTSHRHKGLWYNFGHGHQGLTLAPLSGQLVADALVGGRPLDAALAPARFAL